MSSFTLRCFRCYKRLENLSVCPNCREFLLPYFEEKTKEELLLDEIKSKLKGCDVEIEGLCKDVNAIKNDGKQLEKDYEILDDDMPPLQDDTLECNKALEDKVQQLQKKTDWLIKSQKIMAEENKILSERLDYVSREMQRQAVKYEQLSTENKNLQNVIKQFNEIKLETGMTLKPAVNDVRNAKQENTKKTINKTNRSEKHLYQPINGKGFANGYFKDCDRRTSETDDESENSKRRTVPNKREGTAKLIQRKPKNMSKVRSNGAILNICFDK
uniref:Uncharacterized protein n=1 Tax=Glossina pallidipes TaxID=7398 RepID=A0A1A9Z3Z6_GLOPL